MPDTMSADALPRPFRLLRWFALVSAAVIGGPSKTNPPRCDGGTAPANP